MVSATCVAAVKRRPVSAHRAFLIAALGSMLFGCGTSGGEGKPARVEGGAGTVFKEVAQEVGLEFTHFIGATGQFYLPEIMGPGVGVLDYDNDGDLDIYAVQGAVLEPGKSISDSIWPVPKEHFPGNRLFRNELVPSGALKFTDVTEEAGVGDLKFGQAVATGDYDNDGDVDIYVSNYGPNTLYRNNGDGTFTDVTKEAGVEGGSFSTSAAFVDYDQDGDLDLFVAHYNTFSIEGNKICRAASGEQDYCGPTAYFPMPDRVYENLGNGKFRDVTRETGVAADYGHGLGIVTADFDEDGRIDIYVANDETPNQMWTYRDGRFEDMALMAGAAYNDEGDTEASMGVSAEDFDGDGDIDIFLAHIQQETHTLYLNDGTGNFFDSTDVYGLAHTSRGITGFGALWFDYDNDGWLDIFVNNGLVMMDGGSGGESFPYKQKNQLFRNEGGRRFVDVSAGAGPYFQVREVGRGAAFGDIDNDGDIDIVVANCNGPMRLLLNQIGNRNHWLELRLIGVTVNRDALGTKVALLRRGRKPMWRRVSVDGSYFSANDPRVHFGLGTDADLDAAPIEGVLVVWPNGRSERWPAPEPDRFFTLREGDGTPVS